MLKRLILTFVVAMSAALLGYLSTSLVQAQQPHRQDAERLITHKKFSKWAYEAYVLDKGVNLRVISDVEDKASLEVLLEDQRSSADAVFSSMETAPAVVLFSQALDPKNLPAFASKYNISVLSYTLLAQDTNGEYITFFGAPVGEDVFPEHILVSMTRSIEENRATKITLKGVVSITVRLNSNTFTRLDQADNILGVDLTPALALSDLKSISKEVREVVQDAEQMDLLSITPAPFYWITGR